MLKTLKSEQIRNHLRVRSTLPDRIHGITEVLKKTPKGSHASAEAERGPRKSYNDLQAGLQCLTEAAGLRGRRGTRQRGSVSSKGCKIQRTSCDHCLGLFMNTTGRPQRPSDVITSGRDRALRETELRNRQRDTKATQHQLLLLTSPHK